MILAGLSGDDGKKMSWRRSLAAPETGKNHYEETCFDIYAQAYDRLMSEALRTRRNDLGYYVDAKIRHIARLKPIPQGRVLDFGCGTGRVGKAFKRAFPQTELFGCDLSQESLAIARRTEAYAGLFHVSGGDFEEYAGTFDMVILAGVLHHIPKHRRLSTTLYIKRLLNPVGDLFVFEHNPLNPFARFVMRTCAFDVGVAPIACAEVIRVLRAAGFKALTKRYLLFFPAHLKRISWAENYFDRIPFGAQYVVHAGR